MLSAATLLFRRGDPDIVFFQRPKLCVRANVLPGDGTAKPVIPAFRHPRRRFPGEEEAAALSHERRRNDGSCILRVWTAVECHDLPSEVGHSVGVWWHSHGIFRCDCNGETRELYAAGSSGTSGRRSRCAPTIFWRIGSTASYRSIIRSSPRAIRRSKSGELSPNPSPCKFLAAVETTLGAARPRPSRQDDLEALAEVDFCLRKRCRHVETQKAGEAAKVRARWPKPWEGTLAIARPDSLSRAESESPRSLKGTLPVRSGSDILLVVSISAALLRRSPSITSVEFQSRRRSSPDSDTQSMSAARTSRPVCGSRLQGQHYSCSCSAEAARTDQRRSRIPPSCCRDRRFSSFQSSTTKPTSLSRT